jgi:excisionase family DNA binding protein
MPSNGMSKAAADLLIEQVLKKYDPLDLLTAKEAAEDFRIPQKTIEYYARSGQIPKVQMGRHLRFSPIALAHWYIEQHSIPYRKPGERKGGE